MYVSIGKYVKKPDTLKFHDKTWSTQLHIKTLYILLNIRSMEYDTLENFPQ